MRKPSLADKVKVKREEKQMTQADLAKRSGLTQATISRLERGEVKQLKAEPMRKLAQALGVTADFLLGDAQRMEFAETLVADETAKVIFRGYEHLSEERKRKLITFVNYLVDEEKKDRKQE